MTSEERNIIEGCISKKPLCQKQLYDKYAAKMFAVCLRYARSRSDAEDIFQDAFIKVFNVIRSFNFIGSFEGWLRKVFVNYALNYYRSQKMYVEVNEQDNITFDMSRFTLEEIVSCINCLPDNQRLVFNSVEIDGFSYDEIAIRMQMPVSTARVLNFRAKASLREMLLNKEKFEL
ncbi:MAG: sigma-70 family RNA polymerase sigma factor [Bacteroidales bacterium]|jgi:RNA polymerase sigma-70 factor (ECF subfamily)|nr:sigma-70 family RNA polymerase sigma factor [Bacteroidales bacterium]